MNTKFVEEAESFLEQHPEIREFDLLLPDMNAVFRGKRIQREKLISISKKDSISQLLFLPWMSLGRRWRKPDLVLKAAIRIFPAIRFRKL